MNFLDTFDVARPTTPNPPAAGAAATPVEQPSLNEEVNQVIGQLGRFWGGFRKQSQTALEAARKDFGEVVVQAQKELSKLTTPEAPSAAPRETSGTAEGAAASTTAEGAVAGSSESGEVSSTTGDSAAESTPSAANTPTPSTAAPGTPSDEPSSLSSSTSTLFSRLQSALPPNIVATVQSNITALNIPESIKHASESIDLQGMRTGLLAELQRVQGVTRAQAEEYAHKSEALLREAVKEAGDVLREAVKVIPPEQAAGTSSGGAGPAVVLWDGTEMWLLPADPAETSVGGAEATSGAAAKGLETSSSAVATRAEALLRRLKRDPDILRHDPGVEEGVKERYEAWKANEVDTLDGGSEGAEWRAKIDAALQDPVDGGALKQLEDKLVPSEMALSAFWLRFFFRAYQIRMEEEKRKALIHRSTDNDEDFSWEDEEDELSPATSTSKSAARAAAAPSSTPADAEAPLKESLAIPSGTGETASGANSPRLSSEDSFDLVSSSNDSTAGDAKPATRTAAAEDEDGDSDWE